MDAQIRFRLRFLLIALLPHISACHSTGPRTETARAALTGRLLTQDGKPVAGAEIRIYGGLATRWEIDRTQSDATGRYAFDPLVGGAMVQSSDGSRWDHYVGMSIEHPRYAAADGQSWWDVTVPADEHVTRDFVMQRAGDVHGAVRDPRGLPCRGLALRMCAPNCESVNYIRYAETDEHGTFAEAGLAPGTYLLQENGHPYHEIGAIVIRPGEHSDVSFVYDRTPR